MTGVQTCALPIYVKHGKPNPEPYLIGMKKCGVEPWETIVVENAPLGVQAAVAARCMTIAVNTGPLPDQQLADPGANLIFPTMTALSDAWGTLYKAWNQTPSSSSAATF